MSYPIDRFAAFLAHQLNQGAGGVVRPDLGRLHAVAGEALAGRYAGPLLHQPAYAWRMGAEEAAARWLCQTLRPR